jgi:hypothetical protein
MLSEHARTSFLENKGQWDPKARYLLRSGNLDVWITDSGVVYDQYQMLHSHPEARLKKIPPFSSPRIEDIVTRSGQVVRMSFLNTRCSKAIGSDPQEGTTNWFIGNDPAKWVTGARTFGNVKIQNLYEGIDAVFYLDHGQPRYDLVVYPSADPKQIAIKFEGQDRLLAAEDGSLTIKTKMGDIEECELYAYQVIDGEHRRVDCAFAENQNGNITFTTGEFDQSQPLMIDPLVYSTYLGGWGDASPNSIAVDRFGDAFVAGYTGTSSQLVFPTTSGAYNTVAVSGTTTAYVSKINPTGTALLYSTYLSGKGIDIVNGIAIDDSGNAFVTGQTAGEASTGFLFPTTTGAFQTLPGGGFDAFVTKLNPSGTALLYSTLFGGDTNDIATSIAVDHHGNAYFAGYTQSNGPYPHGIPITPNALQSQNHGGYDVFIAKLDPFGKTMLYSTYLGGEGDDYCYRMAVDSEGHVLLTGYTESADTTVNGFPITQGAFQTTKPGIYSAFISKLNLFGTGLLFSTYLGGYGGCYATGIALDSAGDSFVAGFTYAYGFPTTPTSLEPESNGGQEDAFIAKLNPTGTSLLYSTYLGGSGTDYAGGLAIDQFGNAYVAGSTTSVGPYPTGFPIVPGAFQPQSNGQMNVFFSELNSHGNVLLYSTYLGGKGTEEDGATDVAVDASGAAYVTGVTADHGVYPVGFPLTPGALEDTFSGGKFDGFVAKFSIASSVPAIGLDSIASTVCGSTTLQCTLRNLSRGAMTVDSASATAPFQVQSSQFPLPVLSDTLAQFSVQLVVQSGGTYSGTLQIYYRTQDGTAHDTTLQLAASSTGGGGEVANTISLGTLSVVPLATIGLPVSVQLANIRSLDTMQVEQITFVVTFDSNLLSMDPTKFATEIIPPIGLAFASAAVLPGFLSVTYENDAATKLSNLLDLGHLIFTAHSGPKSSTLVQLGSLVITTSLKDYSYCTQLEGDFIANVTVQGSGVSESLSLASIRLFPNPATAGEATLEITSTQPTTAQIVIYDILGHELGKLSSKVDADEKRDILLPTNGLTPGNYYVRITDGASTRTEKFVIQ